MKKSIIYILTICLFISYVKGQDFEDLIRAGASDGSQYLEAYMEPAMISLSNGLASGWMNTAKNHKLFGVDITVSANFAQIPNELTNFNFRNADYEAFQLDGSLNEGPLPTFGGGEAQNSLFIEAGTTIDIDGTPYTFNERVNIGAIDGIGSDLPFTAVPTPTAQLGIGLFKNTDLKIRFVPTISSDGSEMSLFGIGVMHDIKQWIPGLKLVPIDIVGFAGTTKLSASIDIDDVDDADFAISGASAEMEVSATTIQLMASKKLAIFTPYVGIGYNITSSSVNVKGEYRFKDPVPLNSEPDQVINDPVSLNFNGGSSPRITIGGQLKLLVLTLHADYTIQKYNTFTAGIGISVR